MKLTDQVLLSHGGGGTLTSSLIEQVFVASFSNPILDTMDDSALLDLPHEDSRLAFTTDSYVVNPIFFPGGDIGKLAVCGTVNDLCMVGAVPRYLSCGMILEEGFSMEGLRRIVSSMSETALDAGVLLVTGDTKVVPRGKADGLFINTSGVGWVPEAREVSGSKARPGDAVLLSGTLGDHGVAIMATRENLGIESDLQSDVAPLNSLVEALFAEGIRIHAMRDPTRGGLAQSLGEISRRSSVRIVLDEISIPVREDVVVICDLLGLDVLQVANEGKLVAFLPRDQASRALDVMRSHPLGRRAACIGRVMEGSHVVELRTRAGGRRLVESPSGELLPRIC